MTIRPEPWRKFLKQLQVEAPAHVEMVAAVIGFEIKGIAGGIGFVGAAGITGVVAPGVLGTE